MIGGGCGSGCGLWQWVWALVVGWVWREKGRDEIKNKKDLKNNKKVIF